jgi:hypothetical protein
MHKLRILRNTEKHAHHLVVTTGEDLRVILSSIDLVKSDASNACK